MISTHGNEMWMEWNLSSYFWIYATYWNPKFITKNFERRWFQQWKEGNLQVQILSPINYVMHQTALKLANKNEGKCKLRKWKWGWAGKSY